MYDIVSFFSPDVTDYISTIVNQDIAAKSISQRLASETHQQQASSLLDSERLKELASSQQDSDIPQQLASSPLDSDPSTQLNSSPYLFHLGYIYILRRNPESNGTSGGAHTSIVRSARENFLQIKREKI